MHPLLGHAGTKAGVQGENDAEKTGNAGVLLSLKPNLRGSILTEQIMLF